MDRPILTINGLRPRPPAPAEPVAPPAATTARAPATRATKAIGIRTLVKAKAEAPAPTAEQRQRAMRAKLCQLYPNHFGLAGAAAPLPIETRDVVLKLLTAEGFTAADVRVFTRRWTHSTRYIEALAADGAVRVSLDGSTSEPVADEHREFARLILQQRKRKASTLADPRGRV